MKQSLVGVCFAGVQKLKLQELCPPKMLFLEWMGMAAMIQQRNEVVDQQCSDLQVALSANGFRNCILKGQAVSCYYEETLRNLRQSGDIDIWMDGNHDRIMKYVASISPSDEVRWLHTQLKIFQDTEVELHFRPSYLECPWQDRSLQTFFYNERENCFSSGRCTDRFNQVFILAHAFRHVFGEGVGLRQLMDYYYVLKNSKERLSREEFCRVMKETGMLRFAKAVMWIMNEVFGLEEKYLLCTASESDGRFLLSEVIKSGNFGYLDERVSLVADEGTFQRFWRLTLYNFRVIRFSPWIVVCSPFWRLWPLGLA
ncbi:MAG: nucleotidyltransferase family protein [Prevotellaceae bacterium]|nr:nucleotidyltransferase family protein [Candidatus Colivivens equi]